MAVMAAGGNCAQAVLAAFADGLGLERERALRLASGFGAGLGRRQETCGAVSGGVMALGLRHGPSQEGDIEAREAAYRLARELMARFEHEFGSCLCRELLPGCDLASEAGRRRYREEGWPERVCRPCVRGAVRILEEIL